MPVLGLVSMEGLAQMMDVNYSTVRGTSGKAECHARQSSSIGDPITPRPKRKRWPKPGRKSRLGKT